MYVASSVITNILRVAYQFQLYSDLGTYLPTYPTSPNPSPQMTNSARGWASSQHEKRIYMVCGPWGRHHPVRLSARVQAREGYPGDAVQLRAGKILTAHRPFVSGDPYIECY